jgi:hypothetical protein
MRRAGPVRSNRSRSRLVSGARLLATPWTGRFTFAASTLRLRLESVGRTPRDFVFTSEEGRETFVYQGAYRLLGTSADLVETISVCR